VADKSYSPTTGGTTLAKVWKKMQGKLLVGFNAKCEEYALARDLDEFEIAPSAREVTTPIDIVRQGGGASIPEGGKEAFPYTAAPNELTFTWINENYRFTISLTSQYLDRKSKDTQIVRQVKYQSRKMLEAFVNRVGRQFYGYSSGTVCETSTNATQSSGTYTLQDAYGEADLDNAAFLSGFFQVSDRVALVRSGALVANAIGDVTAVGSGTIDVTWNGSVDADADDIVVFANSIENTTLASGTDHNKWPVGLLDMANTASVHGLSSATAALWDAYRDTSGGRFDFAKLRAGQYKIQNNGGGKANLLIVPNGVETDMTLQGLSAMRFSDSMNLEFDGATKIKGVKLFTSRKVPNSRAWLLDDSALRRWSLVPAPNESGEMPEGFNSNSDKLQDQNAEVVSFDYPYAFVCVNRGKIAYFSGLTES
jgi:hypothetical protein